ncbi:MAG: aldehyde ferredoxin oxidoreductase family protein, partial [Vicinamibacterales bacterium]
MPFGYHGCYLRLDVSTGEVERVQLADAVLRQYIGGSGLGVRILLDEGAAPLDPLSPEALLVFAFSPLVGSPLTTSAKFAVVGKSPLTNRINDSLASSGFAISGKGLGCDALLIVGRAPELSTLVIDAKPSGDHRPPTPDTRGLPIVRLQSAVDLGGFTCEQTEAALRQDLGLDFRIATIGPAGERLVRYATISHDGRHAGRGGSGAVLGSKNVKAIAVRGSRRVEWAHPQELAAISKDLSKRSFGPATAKYRELGTATNLLTFNRFNALPTRNFQAGSFDKAESLSPEQLSTTRSKTRASCVACTIGCEHIYSLGADRGLPADQPPPRLRRSAEASAKAEALAEAGVRLEYENLFALGPLCGVSDPDAVLGASQRCDELGLDTISTGGTIAFAMECVERGWLDEPWLTFGSGDALLRAIELIGSREGLGNLLAQGSRQAAEAIGHDSISIAPQVKGLEMPGYEPRALQTMA